MGKLIKTAKFGIITLAAASALLLLGLSLPIGGRRAMSVQSGSMEPAIKTGAMVFVSRVSADSIIPGDVITYINPHMETQTITHRVLEVKSTQYGTRQFVTKGDANPVSDKLISEKSIIGKVTADVPYAGRVVDFLRHPIGVLLIIYIPAILIVVSETKRLSAYYRSIKRYVLSGYRRTQPKQQGKAMYNGFKVFALLLVSAVIISPISLAAFKSSASLTNNTISVMAKPDEPAQPTSCTVTNSNNVSVNSQSSQTATSGSSTADENTSVGSVSTGNASNTNNSTTTITTTNNSNSCTSQQ